MKRPSATYAFRSLEKSDLTLVGGWLSVPHVSRWWGDPADGLEEIADILDMGLVKPYIGEFLGRPIAYFQAYDPHEEYEHPYADQQEGTRGMDQFIGVPELIGLGHGTAMIKAFASMLFGDGAKRILVDPDPENRMAIRAYEKAGFTRQKMRNTEYGAVLLMHCDAGTEMSKR